MYLKTKDLSKNARFNIIYDMLFYMSCVLGAFAVGLSGVFLCVFQNILNEILPFSFPSNKKKFLFFLFGYFGLFVFIFLWGMCFYLLNFLLVQYDYYSFVNMILFSFFLFVLAFCVSVFFVEAINYQFFLMSFWKDVNFALYMISRCFGYLFIIGSFVLSPLCLVNLFQNLLLGCYWPFIATVFLFFVFIFWLVSFSNQFIFQSSFYLS